MHFTELLQSLGFLATQRPFSAVQTPFAVQPSDFLQAASVAATHVFVSLSRLHAPPVVQPADLSQSSSLFGTQRSAPAQHHPFCAHTFESRQSSLLPTTQVGPSSPSL